MGFVGGGRGPIPCPVCGTAAADLAALSAHFISQAEASEGNHVMWLNRHVTKFQSSAADLEPLLADVLGGGDPAGDRVHR